jgi:uncharacterized protein (TIGR02246 family)
MSTADTTSSDSARRPPRPGVAAASAMKIAVAAAFLALLAQPSVAQTVAGEIENARQQFQQAVNMGDAEMVARMYTERAVVLPPNADMIEGRDAIQNYWRSVIRAGLRNLSARSVRIDEYGGEAAREIGRFIVDPPGPRDRTGPVEGKYVIVWRKSGGEWRHDSDIWNFTEPPEPDVAAGTTAAPAATGTGAPSSSR